MSTIKLRDYQEKFIGDIQHAWQTHRSVLGVLPTGAGKTVCFSAIVQSHNAAAAVIAHRREIVGQISKALARLDIKHRIIAPSETITLIRRQQLSEFGRSFVDPHAATGVISVQTLTSRSSERDVRLQQWLSSVTLAVFDEGHHYVEQGIWSKAVHLLDRARLLFVTATPERADGKPLSFADVLIEGPTTQQLIAEGFLCKFVYKAPASDINLQSIPLTANGDLNTRVLRQRVVESHLVGDLVGHYNQFADGKRAIVFATDVASANEIAAEFLAEGVPAKAISGKTEHRERDTAIQEFEAGRLLVLVNVDLFDEGFDVPAVEAVIMARPTQSLAKYLQMVGRALRPAPGKPHAIIIDAVRNWERHGMPNWPRQWSIEGKGESLGRGGAELIPQRVCVRCTQPYERVYRSCPYCGHEVPAPSGRSAPEQVDGALIDLDVDALSALLARIDRADMSDEAYAADQSRRYIPQIGRRADMRRHRENRARRAELRELIAWWMGLQPADRPLAEKQRRFYYRFGIDVGTAMTLKAKDTDALIQTITERFEYDIVQ